MRFDRVPRPWNSFAFDPAKVRSRIVPGFSLFYRVLHEGTPSRLELETNLPSFTALRVTRLRPDRAGCLVFFLLPCSMIFMERLLVIDSPSSSFSFLTGFFFYRPGLRLKVFFGEIFNPWTRFLLGIGFEAISY